MKQALLIVDLQNDFLPKGSLEVADGDLIIPIINQCICYFDYVLTTLDWHPIDHVSFACNWEKSPGDVIEINGVSQRLWPIHCVQNTHGSSYPSSFNKEKITKAFYKGFDKQIDSYSIFFDSKRQSASEIHNYLQRENIEELFIAGLATDYCVLETVLDACSLGYKVFVIKDACRAVNLNPDDERRALAKMEEKGAFIIESCDLLQKSSYRV